MALTKHDLQAVRSIVREETKDFATKADLTELAAKEDVLDAARRLEAKLASKEDLLEAEGRLTKKVEFETEKLARIAVGETNRLRKRTDELAGHRSGRRPRSRCMRCGTSGAGSGPGS